MKTWTGNLWSWLSLAAVISLNVPLNALAATHYVDANGTNPVAPYTSWATAATNIQDAINIAGVSDMLLVTNGIYQYGAAVRPGQTQTNRVFVPSGLDLTIQSVNGPAVTTIVGYQVPGTTNGVNAIRCVYLTSFSSLSGFTLTNGATQTSQSGGGLVMEASCVVSNCVISGNAAANDGGGVISGNSSLVANCIISRNVAGLYGGGAMECILNNCTVSNNVAKQGGGVWNCTANNSLLAGNGNTNSTDGGAAYDCTLNNCTVVGNLSRVSGAAEGCALVNSIIYYNSNGIYADCYMCRLTNCCTTLGGIGNASLPNNSISNAPAFVNLAGGDYHLQSNSPCINAGNNSYFTGTTDLDGNPRIVGGTVDIGAYEYQTPTSMLSYAWAQQYGLPTDGTADYADLDGDGMNNWQEWKAGTNPTNAASVLALQAPATTNTTGITVTWQSVSGVTYYLLSSTNLPVFTPIQSNLVGQAGSTSYTDTTATNGGPYFYRVGVQ
jgi:hypothetical protein